MKEWSEGNRTIQRSLDDDKGGTMRLGAYDAALIEGSKVSEIYGDTAIERASPPPFRSRHRIPREARGDGALLFRHEPDGRLPEIVEWKDHPWFIGVQFHPELKSKPFAPHPLFADFVRAAVDASRLV